MAKERGRPWWQHLSSPTRALAIAAAVAAFVLAWWRVPILLYAGTSSEDVRVKAITDTRTALLAGLVGLGALGTFWLNSRVYRLTARTFEVTERGHVTDRYSKAIEQLGQDSLDVRLGGIYALEQIAKDSARTEEDQATIVEVLGAFVRVHSDPIYRYKASLPTAGAEEASMLSDEELADRAIDYVTKTAKLPVDVQAAVTVLGRLPYSEIVPRGDLTEAMLRHVTLHTDLTGVTLIRADLSKADLSGAKLGKAHLVRVNLDEANLTEANLTEASLSSACLTEADLSWADLTMASLLGAHLGRANLVGATLTGANLFGADLSGADLREAKLTGARLTGAKLTGAKLARADLTRADLTRANLTEADLTEADLTEADLTRANLTEADLTRADLTRADLTRADLTEADLTEADLTEADLNQALRSP